MAEVTWSPRAGAEFTDTCEFLAKRSESYAGLFAADVLRIVASIPAQPLMGAVVPEYELDTIRERQYQNHRIVYRVDGENVEIITFASVSRRLPRTPPG
jgi:toxin ParE1/3/4